MKRRHPGEPPADPFGERRRGALLRARLLGAEFCFETDSGELLRIVRSAFDGLPAARLAPGAPRLTVKLVLTPGARVSAAPPPGLIRSPRTGSCAAAWPARASPQSCRRNAARSSWCRAAPAPSL